MKDGTVQHQGLGGGWWPPDRRESQLRVPSQGWQPQGSLGRAACPSRVFLTMFSLQKGHGGCARFLLASMNYLDFQGIFLIHKRLFLSTERGRPPEG